MQLVKGKKIIMKRDSSQVAVQLSLQNQNHSEHSEHIDSDCFITHAKHVMQFLFLRTLSMTFEQGQGFFLFFLWGDEIL